MTGGGHPDLSVANSGEDDVADKVVDNVADNVAVFLGVSYGSQTSVMGVAEALEPIGLNPYMSSSVRRT